METNIMPIKKRVDPMDRSNLNDMDSISPDQAAYFMAEAGEAAQNIMRRHKGQGAYAVLLAQKLMELAQREAGNNRPQQDAPKPNAFAMLERNDPDSPWRD